MVHSAYIHDVLDLLRPIIANFMLPGTTLDAVPWGNGHINDTYAVTQAEGHAQRRYILQRINTTVFRDHAALMSNIDRVTRHLQAAITRAGGDADREALRLIPTVDGKAYLQTIDGQVWRAYLFIEGARTWDVVETPQQAFQAAAAFGRFQALLADLPAPRLHETIPNFHHTPSRLGTLLQAVAADTHGRAADAAAEIDFAMARAGITGTLTDLLAAGELPERITHNDTKLNNVMLDDSTGAGVCVIDLDTTMPGLVHYDFGDMVRTTTSPAAEDERDLTKVRMQFPMYEALLRGFMSTAGHVLTPTERHYLPFAGKLIPFEIGLRFLTDYLQGDVYFKTHRPGHNLDRCRTQFALVASVEAQTPAMQALVDSL